LIKATKKNKHNAKENKYKYPTIKGIIITAMKNNNNNIIINS